MKAQGRWEQAVMRSGWGAYEHHLRRCTDIEKRRPCERQKIEALQPLGDLQEDGKVLRGLRGLKGLSRDVGAEGAEVG